MSTFTNYQVPYKKLGDFNILNDDVYTRQVNASEEDTNFTEAAHLTSIPVANTTTVGGVCISEIANNDDGVYSYDGKLYGLMVDTLSAAYVHVPWKNTTYQVEDNCCLSLRQAAEETKDNGGVYVLDVSAIPASKLYNIGDMVNIFNADGEENPYAHFSNVSDDISKPLQDNIDALDTKTTEALAEHNSENQTHFTSIDTSVDLLSAWLHENYYLCTETSNDVEIADALTALSSDFEKYLANTLHEGIQTNPAYLKSQADDISAALSAAVSTDYYKKTDVYSKPETYMKTEVSSKEELDAMFKTKQDCLDVHDSINSTQEYDSKDVATVSAIIAFVNSSINRGTATFQGHFSSVDAIPADGSSTSYKHPVPDKNDYIYVDIAESRTWPSQNGSDVIELSAGTWKFLMNSDKWDTDAGVWNWTPEYRITDTIFTDAQTKALNSGITEALVHQYSRDCANLSALSNDFYTLRGPKFRGVLGNLASVDYIPDNLTGTGTAGQVAVFKDSNALTGMDFSPTRELWTFELQDEGQYVKKYILAQTVETSTKSNN